MPLYTYRREDGTTFDVRQSFSDAPLTVDPHTGQSVVRVVQAAGIIFKGSGFYINDSKSASKANLSTPPKKADDGSPASADSKPAADAPAPAAAAPAPASKPASSAAAD